jgi:hypothetical protein
MAANGAISHDPNLPNEVSNWTELGDNVGRGPSASSIHDAFMNSSEHRAIILDPAFTQIGVGVVDAGDRLYVTEIFVRRATKRVTTVHHATTTRRRSASRPQASLSRAVASDVKLTGVMWEINLGRGMTVSLLEELNGLDAPSVDPQTGTPN